MGVVKDLQTLSWLGQSGGGLGIGVAAEPSVPPTSPAPDAAAANKAPGSWQGTLPGPRAPDAACYRPPHMPQL